MKKNTLDIHFGDVPECASCAARRPWNAPGRRSWSDGLIAAYRRRAQWGPCRTITSTSSPSSPFIYLFFLVIQHPPDVIFASPTEFLYRLCRSRSLRWVSNFATPEITRPPITDVLSFCSRKSVICFLTLRRRFECDRLRLPWTSLANDAGTAVFENKHQMASTLSRAAHMLYPIITLISVNDNNIVQCTR